MAAREDLPVAVIGAGPVGLAAAARLVAGGEDVVVLEAGAEVGASVRAWGHVRLFSPWSFDVDAAAAALLEAEGWRRPEPTAFPTGNDLVDRYLVPLAAVPALAGRIRLATRVRFVTRAGRDKMTTPGRAEAPFLLRLEGPDGEADLLARAVIDASGTWEHANPLGAGGVPAIGEAAVADRIRARLPDVLGAERGRYAGRRVLVVGSGHSAFNVLADLAVLADEAAGTRIHWAVRRPTLGSLFGGGEDDALAERGRLGARIAALVERGVLDVHLGVAIDRLRRTAGGVEVGSAGAPLVEVDEIVATTGFRTDLAMVRELRLALDPAIECPAALGPLIDPNVHSCGTVPPHGAVELAHPDEPDFYMVGMRSYGRAPTALLATGYEQVRSVVAALTGDWAAARRVELVLPETGVCCSNPDDELAGACCGVPVAEPVALGRRPA